MFLFLDHKCVVKEHEKGNQRHKKGFNLDTLMHKKGYPWFLTISNQNEPKRTQNDTKNRNFPDSD